VHKNSDIYSVPMIILDLIVGDPSTLLGQGPVTADQVMAHLPIKDYELCKLIRAMLAQDPEKRITVDEALVHPALSQSALAGSMDALLLDISLSHALAQAQGFQADIPFTFLFRAPPQDLSRAGALIALPEIHHGENPRLVAPNNWTSVVHILEDSEREEGNRAAHATALVTMLRNTLNKLVAEAGSIKDAAAQLQPHTSRNVNSVTKYEADCLTEVLGQSDGELYIHLEHILNSDPFLTKPLSEVKAAPLTKIPKALPFIRVLYKTLIALKNKRM
jgi:hypothetical protein